MKFPNREFRLHPSTISTRRLGARWKNACLALALAALFGAPAAAQDIRVDLAPGILIPLADTDVFGIGGGVSAEVSVDFLGFLAPYVGLDVNFVSPAASSLDRSITLASAGGGIGFFSFPLPRLKVGGSTGAGVYVGSYSGAGKTTMTGNFFWKAALDAGYRITPSLTLSGDIAYTDYMNAEGSFLRGLSLSVVAKLGMASKNAIGKATLEQASSSPVFPILARRYTDSPFGSIVIRNAESAEIRNVEIRFEAEGYSSGPALCARIPYLRKGATTEASILAGFSDQVMAVSEDVKVRGKIIVNYELLGEPRTAVSDTTISILNRNSLTWENPAILASFVSPNDPAVLDSSKFLAGIVRSRARAELDSNLQYALGIFEGLRLSGVSWAADPQTPYSRTHGKTGKVDYVQYPYQTLAYRGGDSDDIAVLFAAELESVGIPSALIPLEGEVLAAFRLSRGEAEIRRAFSDSGDFLFMDGEAWVPLRVTMLREGFLRSWNEGASLVRSTPTAREGFLRVSDAWRDYPPAGVPGIPPSTRKPPEEQVRSAFDSTIALVVAKEVEPRAERMKEAFEPGGGSGKQRNSLGVLYARYGMYQEALAEFRAAAELGHTGAAVNMGNVAFLLGDHETAAAWFEKALADNPAMVAAMIGLARAYYELDRYEEADVLFHKAVELAPELAKMYGYLSARISGSTARASAASDRYGSMVWDE